MTYRCFLQIGIHLYLIYLRLGLHGLMFFFGVAYNSDSVLFIIFELFLDNQQVLRRLNRRKITFKLCQIQYTMRYVLVPSSCCWTLAFTLFAFVYLHF